MTWWRRPCPTGTCWCAARCAVRSAEVAGAHQSHCHLLGPAGIGLRRERAELERWECGQDAVALVLHNGVEYIEAMLGCYRARAVPFNVNQHYRPTEVAGPSPTWASTLSCITGAMGPWSRRRARHPTSCSSTSMTAPGVAAAARQRQLRGGGDDPDRGPLPGAHARRSVPRVHGRTTGRPKAVLWRQADIYVSGMAGTEDATEQSIAEGATLARAPAVPGTRSRRSCTPPRNGRRIRLSTRAPRSFCTMTRARSIRRRSSSWPSVSTWC